MSQTYQDHLSKSHRFPQEGFDLKDDYLTFHDVPIHALIKKHGTPFKLMYLPHIGDQVRKVQELFHQAIEHHDYQGHYHYAYCTKCCHYAEVVKTAVRAGTQLETSSAFDIDLIYNLYAAGEIDQSITLLHNGYKTDDYLRKVIQLNKDGFHQSILILDSRMELERIKPMVHDLPRPLKIGLRMAISETKQSAYQTSRLGIPADEVVNFYNDGIKDCGGISFELLHFFVDSGIKDNVYYWKEFEKALKLFVELKKQCPSLRAIDLGGGFPIRNSLAFDYDYASIISKIVGQLKAICIQSNINDPDIYTEFGKYTVGESGAVIFSVLEQKQQNEKECWYMIDNSLLNTVPDAWTIFEKFVLLPINKWKNTFGQVNIGGISCDHTDYYNSEDLNQEILLPRSTSTETEPLYIGFFHTGAYQDAISGYGGIKHCLIPSPKLIFIDRDADGGIVESVHQRHDKVEEMLGILGY